MDKESLTEKLLDLVEGRETPESWRNWWDEHETELEALLSRGEFLKLKPCRHGFQWVPVFGSQREPSPFWKRTVQHLRPAISTRSGIWRSWTLSVRSRSGCRGKSKRNSRPITRSYLADTPSSPRRWQRCWTPLTRSNPPPRRSRSGIKKACWTSRSRPRCGSFPADRRHQCIHRRNR